MKITSLFSDKPYSALAIAVCFCGDVDPALVTFTTSRFSLSSLCVLGHLDWQNHVLSSGGFGTRLGLGYAGILSPRPWLVLCPRRLRLWYVSDAPDSG